MTESNNKTKCALILSDKIINSADEITVPPYIDDILKKVIGDSYD